VSVTRSSSSAGHARACPRPTAATAPRTWRTCSAGRLWHCSTPRTRGRLRASRARPSRRGRARSIPMLTPAWLCACATGPAAGGGLGAVPFRPAHQLRPSRALSGARPAVRARARLAGTRQHARRARARPVLVARGQARAHTHALRGVRRGAIRGARARVLGPVSVDQSRHHTYTGGCACIAARDPLGLGQHVRWVQGFVRRRWARRTGLGPGAAAGDERAVRTSERAHN
jgi:hypothetical protein